MNHFWIERGSRKFPFARTREIHPVHPKSHVLINRSSEELSGKLGKIGGSLDVEGEIDKEVGEEGSF